MFGSVPVISNSVRASVPTIKSPSSNTKSQPGQGPGLANTTPYNQIIRNAVGHQAYSTPQNYQNQQVEFVETPASIGSTSKQLFSSPFFNLSQQQQHIISNNTHSNNTQNHGQIMDNHDSATGSSYSKILNVVQHQVDGDRTSSLQVAVKNQQSNVGQNMSRSVSVTLTDPHEYFFYYSVTLTEEDFTNLKQIQGLLVDFSNFPNMLVQLLDKCLSECQSSQPKFVLVLNMTKPQPCLEFTELNMFKHLVHLSLVVLKASDTQLKDYLVTSITKLNQDKEHTKFELQRQIESLHQQLESSSEQLHQRTTELESVKLEMSSKANTLEKRLTRDVEGEKEKANQQIQEIQWKYDSERREAETKQTKIVQQLENRIASLEVQNRDLWEVRVGQESSLREARGQLSCRDEEVARLRRDLAALRQEKVLVETVGTDRDKQVHQLTNRLSRVEQDLQEKEAQVTRLQDAEKLVQETKDRLVAQLDEKTKLVEKRETTIKKLSAEILKANEIIGKLQVCLKKEQEEVKKRGIIAIGQEKDLKNMNKELEECREQLRVRKEKIDCLNVRVTELDKMVSEKDNKIDDLQQRIKTNENMIDRLYKEKDRSTLPTTSSNVKRAGIGGSGVRGRGRLPLGNVQNHTRSSPDVVSDSGKVQVTPEAGGLDPKYFVQSTPGGTNYRHEIPQNLPANVRRGAGLVRRDV